MFPVVDLKNKSNIFVSILWKQLNRLGNIGFDPETFRINPYRIAQFVHAYSVFPLASDIDHWGRGLTASSNLRLLEWQVCKKKHNKLECRLFIFPRQFATTLSSKMTIHVQATIHTLDDSKIITPPIAPLNEDINQWKQHGETFYMNFRVGEEEAQAKMSCSVSELFLHEQLFLLYCGGMWKLPEFLVPTNGWPCQAHRRMLLMEEGQLIK
ncbi:hypothetical protein Ccrd_008268 [Cynara cardunculus var. scolymus]|uniref:Uncharacterized protein n=1 Tax=Cynara cardunculus var. scolymus TaxID=59895 RepID=A0A103XFK4_CYNCS|nr:hypothetical protein Ccrd_008268 [Cynara cardunculus var. scolymus]